MPLRHSPPRPLDISRTQRAFGYGAFSAGQIHNASPTSPYRDQPSPLSPLTPAVIGTARLWQPSPALTPRIVEIPAPHAHDAPQHGLRGGRDYSPQSLADRHHLSLRKDAWVRQRGQPEPRFPYGLRSPFFQSLIGGLILGACLTAFLTLRHNEDLAISLQITFVFLIISSAILVIHGIMRMWLDHHRTSSLRRMASHSYHSHHRRGHHSRRRHLEPRYREPASPFDQLPPDDSLYSPITPVRVHVLRDEEAMIGEKLEEENDNSQPPAGILSPPPPAYGQWRCSVRADPALLHWERYDEGNAGDPCTKEQEMIQRSGPRRSVAALRRLPSYRSSRGEELREDDTGMSMEPGAFVVDNTQIRRASMAVEEAGRMLRSGRASL